MSGSRNCTLVGTSSTKQVPGIVNGNEILALPRSGLIQEQMVERVRRDIVMSVPRGGCGVLRAHRSSLWSEDVFTGAV